MSRKLTLRLRDEDQRAITAAAVKIAGTAGAPCVGTMRAIRAALVAFTADPERSAAADVDVLA